ncbi:MAG TPA: HEAT repeat domain-containing protein [Phototrophicaceae bacterium]|nr:HEAT repeat domain-containing protein [Phototrophicaceae bacterium]
MLFFLVAMVAGVIALFDPLRILWDRFAPDNELRPVRPYKIGTVERYFQVWLTEYGREQALFSTMGGDTVVQNRYRDNKQITYSDIVEVVEDYSRFVIIGEPGEGKSSAMKSLMAQTIHNHRLSHGQTPLPLWINLGYSENPVEAGDLIGYWWYEQHRLPGTPDVYLNRGNLVLYLDGLNEMPEAEGSRKTRTESLRKFLERYPKLPVVVSCRIRDYEDDQDLNLGLPILRVLSMDERRIQKFIKSQLDSTALWDVISASPELKWLAGSAYRLRMMIDLYQSKGTPLPDNLTALFKSYVRQRYDEYARTGKVRVKSAEELEKRLHTLAFHMIIRGEGTGISSSYAQRQIGRAALRDALDLRLMRREDAVVRFYNHALHGYFAAPMMEQTLREGDSSENILPHAVDTLHKIGDMGEPAEPAVAELIRLLSDRNPVVRRMAAFALGRIGEPAAPAVSELVKALADNEQNVRDFAAYALGRIGEAAAPALPILIPALKDQQPIVRFGAALALRQIGKAATPAMNALINALTDENQEVGQLAALALGQMGAPAAEAVPALVTMLGNRNPDLRFSSAYALGRIGEPAMPELLKTLESKDSGLRVSAAMALGEAGKAAATAIPALTVALGDHESEVRHSAALALEKINTPAAREALSHYTGN